MTRISWCEWRPGPLDRRGYGGIKSLPLPRKEGEVKHSTEGGLTAALGVFTDPTRQASWHFTLPKVGPVRAYQHYELEDICWHCGLPGDERQDTSLIGNITLIGEEHEGRAGEPLTPWQVENTIRLSRDIRALCPAIGAPALRVNLWEHGWLSSTSCPSGRIPWQAIIKALEEDDMPDWFKQADWERVRDRVDALFGWVSSSDASPYRIVHDPRDGKVHVVAFGTRRHLQSPEAMWVSGYHWGEVQSLPAVAAMKGMSEAAVYAAFDGLPEQD